MNAFFALLIWFISMFSPEAALIPQDNSSNGPSVADLQGVHIINVNPRTVVALEDTHFRPSR